MTRRTKWIVTFVLFCAIAIPMTTYATNTYSEQPSANRIHEIDGGINLDLSALSALLGIDADDIAAALQQGQSINELAHNHHINLQQVIDSQVAKFVDRLESLRDASKITDDQYEKLKSRFTDQLTYYMSMLSGAEEPKSPNPPKKISVDPGQLHHL
ncbi:hypothetical protein BVG16_01795 [Paenibacillus selenitireducens]|uniref:Uncharacterized protein n=2 Tax=Paenibacillus selenitireducens TaxID=1324314 RepID=A0A1T2XMY3_9BACL|nr:hypothetical protein BVG16_01795 [Paenibacillus selenitireducens]